MSLYEVKGYGWLPDFPDYRDYSIESTDVKPLFRESNIMDIEISSINTKKDLRRWCSPIEDQGSLGSCTAHAGVALIEYYERRAFNKHIDASRLFLYKVTRNLLHWKGDKGAFLRSTIGAMRLFGVPPEEYWPYNINNFDEEPSAFCYAFAQNYQAIKYVRLDHPTTSKEKLLEKIKVCINAGFPPMFGFTVFADAITQSNSNGGLIPMPHDKDKVRGGHAVVAVGYDDSKVIKNSIGESRGAILIRNSWGERWGDKGYGWLPYDYVLRGLTKDWWILVKKEWIDTGEFKL